MSYELIHTSVPQGLKANRSGFCTAAHTSGMSKKMAISLEQLSAYDFHFNISDPQANLNPVNYAHARITIGQETYSVLSRIGFSGADYSGRENRIAHHVLLAADERMPNGPAWMISQMDGSVFRSKWEGPAELLPRLALGAVLDSRQTTIPTPAEHWGKITGDAGWGGMLAKAFRQNKKVPAFVVFKPGQQLLPLFEESLSILPAEERWQVCFTTYHTSTPAGCHYHWRGVIAGSSMASEIRRFPNAMVIDLTKQFALAENNAYTEAARTGNTAAIAPPPSIPVTKPSKDKQLNIADTMLVSKNGHKTLSKSSKSKPQRQTKHIRPPQKIAGKPVTVVKNSAEMRAMVGCLVVVVIGLLITNLFTFMKLSDTKDELKLAQLGVSDTSKPRIDNVAGSGSRNQHSNPKTTLPPINPNAAYPKQSAIGNQSSEASQDTVPKPNAMPQKPIEKTPPPVKTHQPTKFAAELVDRSSIDFADYTITRLWQKKDLSYDVGRSTAILDKPEKIGKYDLKFQMDDGHLTVKCKKSSGYGTEALLKKCQLKQAESDRNQLVWIPKDKLKPNYAEMLKYIVIETIDHDDQRIYQCLFRKKRQPIEKEITLGHEKNGTRITESATIHYPWPKTLTFEDGRREKIFEWETDDIDITCKLELKLDGKSTILEATSGILDEIDEDFIDVQIWKKLGKIEKQQVLIERNEQRIAQNKQDGKETQPKFLNSYERNKQNLASMKEELDEISRKIDKKRIERDQIDIDAKITNIKTLTKAMSNTVNNQRPVMIVDAWGVPIAAVKLNFKRFNQKLLPKVQDKNN